MAAKKKSAKGKRPASRRPAKKAVRKPVKKPAKKAARKPAKKPVRKSINKRSKNAPRKAAKVKPGASKPARKPARNAKKKPAGKLAAKSTRKAGKPVKKSAKKTPVAAKKETASRSAAERPAVVVKTKKKIVKKAEKKAEAKTAKKTARGDAGKPHAPLPAAAQTGRAAYAAGRRVTGFPTRLDEPNDADEYEEMRSKAAVPFQRPEVMPKPGTAGRLFDDEEGLENYDPLFDEMDEEADD